MGGKGSGRGPGRPPNIPYEDDFDPPDESGIEEFFNHPGAQRVQIRKIHTSGRRESCETASLEEIIDDPAKFLREGYGAGLYECTLKGEKGTTLKVRRIHVAPKNEREIVLAPAAPPVEPMNGKMDIVALLMQQNTHMQQLLITAIKPADPAQMLTAMVAAFREVKTSAAPAASGSMSEARELVAFARELSGRAPARDEGEEGGSDWGWLAEIGKRVVAALPNAAGPRAPAAPAQLPANGGELPEDDEQMFFADLKQGVEMLVGRARAGIDPESCAAMVIAEAGWSGPCSAVLEALRQGATIAQLKQYAPDITPEIEAWAERFYAAIQKSNGAGTGADSSGSRDPAGTGGNVANTSNHAGGSSPVKP